MEACKAGSSQSGVSLSHSATIAPAQMPRHFVEQWKQNIKRFPRGVDIILA
ncbi:phosphonate C-P lyase system protein PhnH, partial [Mesorhizobium sp. M7A.F.Ca.CA.001.12.2.1]|uniref:phosphonate C-P lyase system protein PhnH n=1 Tax=Mesorhizobium sp. M7A.F.Ca.CA.001.12.2.1 TaxID=2496725 RepID=UPI0032AFB8D1